MFKNMFKKTYTKIDTKYYASEKSAEQDGQPEQAIKEGTAEEQSSPQIPADLWRKCNKCGKPIYVEDVYSNHNICPKCGGYFRISAYRRIKLLADQGSFEEWDKEMEALYEKTITFGAAIYPNSDITSSLSASRSIAFKPRHERSCL